MLRNLLGQNLILLLLKKIWMWKSIKVIQIYSKVVKVKKIIIILKWRVFCKGNLRKSWWVKKKILKKKIRIKIFIFCCNNLIKVLKRRKVLKNYRKIIIYMFSNNVSKKLIVIIYMFSHNVNKRIIIYNNNNRNQNLNLNLLRLKKITKILLINQEFYQ